MIYQDLTEKIIRAFYDVHDELGGGFLESVYENALMISIGGKGLGVHQQEEIKVYFQGEVVGEFRADLIVENKVLVELKACKALNEAHTAQILNYLKATRMEVGLLVNFGPKLEFRRFVNSP